MKKLIFSTAFAVLLTGNAAFGANFTSSIVATGTNDWGTTTNFGSVPSAGNTYEILVGGVIRSPVGNSTFAGDSLTLDGDGVIPTQNTAPLTGEGELQVKNNPSTTFSANIILNGGVINDGPGGTAAQTITMGGTLTVNAINSAGNSNGSSISVGANIGDKYIVTASVSGSGRLNLTSQTGHPSPLVPNFDFQSTNNTFNGTWNINRAFVLASGLNSLGSADIILNGTATFSSTLETGYTFNDTGHTLTMTSTGAVLDLNQNWTFDSLIYNGTTLSTPGTYTISQLETDLGMTNSNFTDFTSSNTITIDSPVPEPSSLALLGLGAIGLLFLGRRHRGYASE